MKQEKARRVSEINTGRINKRKYYGVGVEVDEYKEALEYHFNHTEAIEQLEDVIVSVGGQEDVADKISSQTNFLRDDEDAVLEDAREPLGNSFEKGTRRAFNSQGDTLPAPENIEEQVQDILQEQKNYISKLNNDMRQKAEEIIRNGLAAGLTKTEIVDRLRTELKNMVDNRSSTIAESEVTKAASTGVLATFESNGVNEVVWVSSQDSKVCKPGNFRVTFNGTTYTSCRELDGESFELPRVPRPVRQSHANCRCVLVANDADV